MRSRGEKKLRVWAAACSRGQEVYSLSMYLDYHLKRLDPSMTFEILGTDIDRESVNIAKNGVYLRQELKEAPLTLLADHWVRGSGEIENYVKVKSSLRGKCNFDVKNLLELKPSDSLGGLPAEQKFDIIFCRNVFIYFNSEQIATITNSLMSRLDTRGYLFVGISESLAGLKLPIQSVGPSVYRRPVKVEPAAAASKGATPASKPVSVPAPVAVKQGPIRVLCVDDSSSILTVLKQILSPAHGFEIIGTAMNGLEAAKKIPELKPDVVTLDIHMPEQNGIEYLEKNYKVGHPPVVMITSVSRDDATLAGRALSLGAGDYVEKPALSNLGERGEEIRAKIKCVAYSSGAERSLGLDQSFQTKHAIKQNDDKLRVISCSLSHRDKLKHILRELPDPQPPTVLLVEGAKAVLPEMAKLLTRSVGRTVTHFDEVPMDLKPSQIVLLDFGSCAKKVAETYSKKLKVSIMALGELSKGSCEQLLGFEGAHLIVEDMGGGKGAAGLMEAANDFVAFTSFAYHSQEYFYSLEEKKKVA